MPLSLIHGRMSREKSEVLCVFSREEQTFFSARREVYEKAGAQLEKTISKLLPLRPGEIAVTNGYGTGARYIFHLYLPDFEEDPKEAEKLLRKEYAKAVEKCATLHCSSISFSLPGSVSHQLKTGQAIDLATEGIEQGLLKNPKLDVRLIIQKPEIHDIPAEERIQVLRYIRNHYVHSNESKKGYGLYGLSAQEELELLTAWHEEKQTPLFSLPDEAPTQAAQAPGVQTAEEYPEYSSIRMEDVIRQLERQDKGFSEKLLALIDARHMTDAECYKKANISRKLFSKIRSNPAYHPSKNTVIAFAVALNLDLEETEELLKSAGYAFSPSSRMDLIIQYCIEKGLSDVNEINQILYSFDQPLLGG